MNGACILLIADAQLNDARGSRRLLLWCACPHNKCHREVILMGKERHAGRIAFHTVDKLSHRLPNVMGRRSIEAPT
jgi:hypothetical protein